MLTTAQVWAILLIHVGIILVVTAYYTVTAALLPGLSERAAARFGQRPWLAALVGVLISLPWVVVALGMMGRGGPVAGIGSVIGLLWILCGLVGGGGLALHVGRGGDDRRPSHATIRGGLLITLAWMLPLIGWFFVLPLSIATGIGCLLLGMLPRRPAAVEFTGAFGGGAGGGGGQPGLAMFDEGRSS